MTARFLVLVVVAAVALACGRPSPPPDQVDITKVQIAPPGDYEPDDLAQVDEDALRTMDVKDCHYVDGVLPDLNCTPGAWNKKISDLSKSETICNPNWSTRSVRPSTSYTNRIKQTVMAWYHVQDRDPAEFELDHLVPLALGGDPRDIANLWPQPRRPTPGFPEKDRVERFLQIQVCDGKVGLDDARSGIAKDFRIYLDQSSRVVLPFDFDPQGEP